MRQGANDQFVVSAAKTSVEAGACKDLTVSLAPAAKEQMAIGKSITATLKITCKADATVVFLVALTAFILA